MDSKEGISSTGTKRPEACICKHISIPSPFCSKPHLLQGAAARGGFFPALSFRHVSTGWSLNHYSFTPRILVIFLCNTCWRGRKKYDFSRALNIFTVTLGKLLSTDIPGQAAYPLFLLRNCDIGFLSTYNHRNSSASVYNQVTPWL